MRFSNAGRLSHTRWQGPQFSITRLSLLLPTSSLIRSAVPGGYGTFAKKCSRPQHCCVFAGLDHTDTTPMARWCIFFLRYAIALGVLAHDGVRQRGGDSWSEE